MFTEIGLMNFLSFKNVKIDFMSRGNPLKYAMIYGENGSGKTNIIDSVAFLSGEMDSLNRMSEAPAASLGHRNNEDNPDDIDKQLDSLLSLFRKTVMNTDPRDIRKRYHSKSIEENTRVEYVFLVNGNKAIYTMEFDRNGRIVHEQLKHKINKGLGTFYSIFWDGTDTNVSINHELITDGGYRKELSDNIRKHWGNHSLLAIINADRKNLMSEYMRASVKKELLDIMDYISSLVVIENDRSGPLGKTYRYLSGKIESDRESDLDAMESVINKFFTRLYSHTVKVEFKRRDDGDYIHYRLVFHRKINGQVVEIDAVQESAGTLHLLGLVYPILASVTGSVVFIDELDNGIHDGLLIDLVGQVIQNIRGQLICTTHESMLLDVISPSSAFVIQVDGNGNKNISSIAAMENVHKNNSVQKRFLGGRYMGVPIPTMLMLDEISEDFHEEDIWRRSDDRCHRDSPWAIRDHPLPGDLQSVGFHQICYRFKG